MASTNYKIIITVENNNSQEFEQGILFVRSYTRSSPAGDAFASRERVQSVTRREFLPPLTWVQVERGTPSVRVELESINLTFPIERVYRGTEFKG